MDKARSITSQEIYLSKIEFKDSYLSKMVADDKTSTVAWRYFSSAATSEDYAKSKTSFLGRFIWLPIGIITTVALTIYHIACIALKLIPFCSSLSYLEIIKQLVVCLGRDGLELFGHLLSPFTLYGVNLVEHNRAQKAVLLNDGKKQLFVKFLTFLIKEEHSISNFMSLYEAPTKRYGAFIELLTLVYGEKGTCDNTQVNVSLNTWFKDINYDWTANDLEMLKKFLKNNANYQIDINSLIDNLIVKGKYQESFDLILLVKNRNIHLKKLFERIHKEKKENALNIILPLIGNRNINQILLPVCKAIISEGTNAPLLLLLLKGTEKISHCTQISLFKNFDESNGELWKNFFNLIETSNSEEDQNLSKPERALKNIRKVFEVEDQKILLSKLVMHYTKEKDINSLKTMLKKSFSELNIKKILSTFLKSDQMKYEELILLSDAIEPVSKDWIKFHVKEKEKCNEKNMESFIEAMSKSTNKDKYLNELYGEFVAKKYHDKSSCWTSLYSCALSISDGNSLNYKEGKLTYLHRTIIEKLLQESTFEESSYKVLKNILNVHSKKIADNTNCIMVWLETIEKISEANKKKKTLQKLQECLKESQKDDYAPLISNKIKELENK